MDFSMSRHFMKSKAPVQRRSVTFVEGSKAADDKNKKDDGSMTLKMDNLYTDIDIADLYFRDWGYHHHLINESSLSLFCIGNSLK